MVTIWKGYWSIEDVRKHPKKLWVFGDNTEGWGQRGQACIRKAPNAIGIPTKWSPSMRKGAFFSDDDYDEIVEIIDERISLICFLLPGYEGIVLPEAGLGTGLSELDKRAPKVFDYLCASIEKLKKEV